MSSNIMQINSAMMSSHEILKSNFYVDNLIVTSNSTEFLEKVYSKSLNRIKQGGFCLCYWNSNGQALQTVMSKDGSLAHHGNNYKKVLSLKFYSLETDSIQLSDSVLDSSANTKRSILSQISKIFDPLGLLFPLLLRTNFS